MRLKIEKWAVKHISFDMYMVFDRFFEFVKKILLTIRYFFFTRTKFGTPIRGTLSPGFQQILENSFFHSIPYLLILILLEIASFVLPNELSENIIYTGDKSILAGFMTATLAIAGVFLTLFYTSAAAVLSNRYPSNDGTISTLFIRAALSNRDLNYCNAFVVVSVACFLFLGAGIVNFLVVAYMALLTVILVIRFPKVLKLSTQTTSISSIGAIPANRFLSFAQASSFNHSFYDSEWLTTNFSRMAKREISSLQSLMEYSINSGEYSNAYVKAVAELVVEILVKYSRISVSIPIDSKWHLEDAEHTSWFMADFYEVQFAVSTGRIPHPKNRPNLTGFHGQLWSIACQYQKMLLSTNNIDDFANWFYLQELMIECCINNEDMNWTFGKILPILTEAIDLALALPADNREQLQQKLYLLEICSGNFIVPSIEFSKKIGSTKTETFNFQQFDSFSQLEVQKKGFPLGLNSNLIDLCKKIEYEKSIYGRTVTPFWYFDERVSKLGVEMLDRCGSFICSVYEEFVKRLFNSADSHSSSCYILVFKEAELYRRTINCLAVLKQFSNDAYSGCGKLEEHSQIIDGKHSEVVRKYPDFAKSFFQDGDRFDEFFPDFYGFAYFNYFDQLHKLIIERNIKEFIEVIPSLFQLVSLSSSALTRKLEDKQLDEGYKVQVLMEPSILFLELCGMAFCMSELLEDKDSQASIQKHVDAILDDFPDEHTRWGICLELSLDPFFNKTSTVLFEWRRLFEDTILKENLYPDLPYHPFTRINRELKPNEKRLLEMLPLGISKYGNFDGCKVFQKFLFNEGGSSE